MSVPNRPRISKENVLTISGHVIKIASLFPVCQTVAKIAEEILTLADTTNRNQEVLKLLAERVEASSLWLLELHPKEEKCKRAYKRYIDVLTEIKDYMKELSKPGKFSKRFLKKVAMFLVAKDVQNLYIVYKSRLDEAIREFSLALNCDCNDLLHKYIEHLSTIRASFTEQRRQLTEIQESIVLMRKGIEMPESEFEKIRLNPEWIRNEDGEEPEIRGRNRQIKRQLYGSQEVAVKKIKILEDEKENRKSIYKYAFLMSKLSHCNSIEKFYGTLLINHELHIVSEWAEKGNLEDFLRSDQELSWLHRFKIAEQIANALEFIHRTEIYHHDVRSRNVLLDKYLDAKLTGFDYSRLHNQSTTSNEEQILSLRWTAPEKLDREDPVPYKKECDIYSFSITLWEIGMRKKPFEEIKDDILVADYVFKDGGRPTLSPSDVPIEYIELMKKGWSAHAGNRPEIKIMREKLHKLTKQYQEYHHNSSSASTLQNINSNFTSTISQPTAMPNQSSDHNDSLQDRPLPPFEDLIELHEKEKYSTAFPSFQQYKDEGSAMKYLRQVADEGKVEAQVLYAKVCLKGSAYDPENGIKYLKKAVEQEDQSALEMWAEILYNGEHDQEIDLKEAFSIWTKAVNKGSKLKLLFEENKENKDVDRKKILTIAASIISIILLFIFFD